MARWRQDQDGFPIRVVSLAKGRGARGRSDSLAELAHRAEVGAAEGRQRMAVAAMEAVRAWRSERDKNADRKTDGAFRDLPHRHVKAIARFVRHASHAPGDVIRKVHGRDPRRELLARILLPIYR